MATAGFAERAKTLGVAARAFAFPASIVPIVLGTVYAWYAGHVFNWGMFVWALLAGMLYHTGCNLINDYYDHKQGLDREDTYGGSGVLVSKAMTPGEVLRSGYAFLALGTLIGLYFIYHFHTHPETPFPYGWPILAIGAAGLSAAILYTATPLSAKYNALGVPLVFTMMGPGMVLGAYFVQAGTQDWRPLLIS
ncbi:prenyltransferase, partial [bacterium]|nr:prenyltransferase [bacterium]